MSNGPCSESGQVSSIDTKIIPFFLKKKGGTQKFDIRDVW
jgi:hypothetical protein